MDLKPEDLLGLQDEVEEMAEEVMTLWRKKAEEIQSIGVLYSYGLHDSQDYSLFLYDCGLTIRDSF